MSLIVEDGSVVDSADSFISLTDARTYATKYGITIPTDDDLAEIALRQAYLVLSVSESKLQGRRVEQAQTGIFPRDDVILYGEPMDSDSVPLGAVMAQLYACESIGNGYEMNKIKTGQDLESFSVDGVYSEAYMSSARTKTNATIQGVVNSLSPYTKSAVAGGGLTRNEEGYRNGWF